MPTKKSQAVLETRTSRRELLKKAAYATPVILTLAATPAFAGKGSKSDKPSRSKERKGSKKY